MFHITFLIYLFYLVLYMNILFGRSWSRTYVESHVQKLWIYIFPIALKSIKYYIWFPEIFVLNIPRHQFWFSVIFHQWEWILSNIQFWNQFSVLTSFNQYSEYVIYANFSSVFRNSFVLMVVHLRHYISSILSTSWQETTEKAGKETSNKKSKPGSGKKKK